MTPEKEDTAGLTLRQLFLEVRDDVKKLTEEGLPRRVRTLENALRGAIAAICIQFLAIIVAAIYQGLQ